MDKYITAAEKAAKWIDNNSIDRKGIVVSTGRRVIYPEVTGYYIPTLLDIGKTDLAISYAEHLLSIQKEDGSWYNAADTAPYVFDSAQILKGLIAIRDILPKVDESIIKGTDWLLSNMEEDGHLTTPTKKAWGKYENWCSELIHTYCITNIRDAGVVFNRDDYLEKADRICRYYVTNYRDKIVNYSLLSHFYSYVMEGLWDMGEHDIIKEAMDNIKKYQASDGSIPGLVDVKWVCSTGLIQFALVWYKMGEGDFADRALDYAVGIQNPTGGWYGSYQSSVLDKFRIGYKRLRYFPTEEISWAVKFFFDALLAGEKIPQKCFDKQ